MRVFASVLGFLSIAQGLTGCSFWYSTPGLNGVRQAISREQIAVAPLSFQTVDDLILRPNGCTDCHSAARNKGGYELDTFHLVVANLADISAAVSSAKMPLAPYPLLDSCQLSLLKTWIDAGAPEKNSKAVGSLPGCGLAPPIDSAPSIPPAAPFIDDDRLDYGTVRARVFEVNCQKCHGSSLAKGKINFEDPGQAHAHGFDAWREAVQDGTMPPSDSDVPRLTPCQAKLLKAWVDLDAPVTGSVPVPDIPDCRPASAPAPAPTFAYFLKNSYASTCIHCHGPGGRADDVDLTTAAQLIADGNVIPGDGAGSPLYKDVIKTGKGQMPPLASLLPPLTAGEAAALKAWIDEGAHP